MIKLLDHENLDQIVFNFEADKEVKILKSELEKYEKELLELLRDNDELHELYLRIEEHTNHLNSLEITYFYETGFKDALKFLINDERGE